MNLLPPDAEQATALQLRAPALLLEVQSLTVADDASYVAVCECELVAKEFLKKVKAVTDDIKEKHKAALDSALGPWGKITAPFEAAKDLAVEKRTAYRREQERVAQVEAARQLAAATAQAKAEREEAVTALTEAYDATQDPQFKEVVDRLQSSGLTVTPVQTGPAVPKVKGIRNTKTITITVTDKKALIMAVGAMLILELDILIDPESLEALAGLLVPSDMDSLMADESWLKTCYRQRKEAFSFPGVAATYE